MTILQREFKPLAPPVFTNKMTWLARAYSKFCGVKKEEEEEKEKKSIC